MGHLDFLLQRHTSSFFHTQLSSASLSKCWVGCLQDLCLSSISSLTFAVSVNLDIEFDKFSLNRMAPLQQLFQPDMHLQRLKRQWFQSQVFLRQFV